MAPSAEHASYRCQHPRCPLNALRHGYVHLGADVGLLVFDEAHHAVDKRSYNILMRKFYDALPHRMPGDVNKTMRPTILGLTASPIFGGNAERAFRQVNQTPPTSSFEGFKLLGPFVLGTGNSSLIWIPPSIHRFYLAKILSVTYTALILSMSSTQSQSISS